jgi:hypothetical protein
MSRLRTPAEWMSFAQVPPKHERKASPSLKCSLKAILHGLAIDAQGCSLSLEHCILDKDVVVIRLWRMILEGGAVVVKFLMTR